MDQEVSENQRNSKIHFMIFESLVGMRIYINWFYVTELVRDFGYLQMRKRYGRCYRNPFPACITDLFTIPSIPTINMQSINAHPKRQSPFRRKLRSCRPTELIHEFITRIILAHFSGKNIAHIRERKKISSFDVYPDTNNRNI